MAGNEYRKIKRSTLVGIGDAIREKTGENEQIPVPSLENKIREIKTEPKLTDLSVVPSAAAKYALPPEGYEGFYKVTVEAAPLAALVATPTEESQVFTPQNGTIGFSVVTVEAAEGGGTAEELPNAMEVSF